MGSLSYLERTREFWILARLQRGMKLGIGTRLDAQSRSRDLRDFFQLSIVCIFIPQIIHVTFQSFVDLYACSIRAMRDVNGRFTRLSEDPILDPFFDITPDTGFQLFPMIGPEAVFELIKLVPKGIEHSFELISVYAGAGLEVRYLQKIGPGQRHDEG